MIDNIREVTSKDDFLEWKIEEIEPIDSKLLEDILNEIPPLVHAKLLHKDITVFKADSHKDRKKMKFFPLYNFF